MSLFPSRQFFIAILLQVVVVPSRMIVLVLTLGKLIWRTRCPRRIQALPGVVDAIIALQLLMTAFNMRQELLGHLGLLVQMLDVAEKRKIAGQSRPNAPQAGATESLSRDSYKS
jgi:hypothetical protein